MKPHIAALFAILGIVLAAGLPAEPRKAITQGEFAVLFVQFLHLDPHKEWTPDEATRALGDELGIEPMDGWQNDTPLTEGDLVTLIRVAKMPVLSPDPSRTVTPLEAKAVLRRIERLYKTSFVPNRAPTGVPLTRTGSGGHPEGGRSHQK
jgi:hypothetical protein